MTLVFIDTETTGLNPFIHDLIEVAWAVDEGPITTVILPHTLTNADPKALQINGYFARGLDADPGFYKDPMRALIRDLQDATLVGSNPSFDAAFLHKKLGVAVWKYRLIDVAQGAMWIFGWDEPKGLFDVAKSLRDLGHDIPDPDHTAAGDVVATRAVYRALRATDLELV